jgi:DNA excision repair protein ERCC-4
VYLAGGCVSITSRILIVDLLHNVIATDLIDGLIINAAHRVTDTSTEAFIIRIYRQRNKVGFIKAFSEQAESLMKGFFKVEKVMKCLHVKKLLLWPRFHISVNETLQRAQPDVIELHHSLTPGWYILCIITVLSSVNTIHGTCACGIAMKGIQGALVEVMDACITELKQANKQMAFFGSITVENGLSHNFDQIIRRELDPVWHKVGAKTKQLLQDLSTLRNCLTYLLSYDCVTFYRFLLTSMPYHAIHPLLQLLTFSGLNSNPQWL